MNEVEAVGFAMWKAEADRAAPNVGKNRAIENYRYDLDPTSRAKWDQIAQAAIAALDAARGDADPVAWMYSHPSDPFPPSVRKDRHERFDFSAMAKRGWAETPLYAHPPRGDKVARVVEWLRDCALSSAIPDDPAQMIADLADAIERGDPFNG
jgi:hypothetical protein